MKRKDLERYQTFFSGAAALLLCAIVGLSVTLIVQNSPKPSVRADYPVMSEPPLLDFIILPLNNAVGDAELVIDATVNRVVTIPPPQYIIEPDYSGINVEFTVNETLKGDPLKNVTMYINKAFVDYSPDFKPGDHVICFLDQDGRQYVPYGLQAYFYVSYDYKVYSALITPLLEMYDGEDVNRFKVNIRNIVHRSPYMSDADLGTKAQESPVE